VSVTDMAERVRILLVEDEATIARVTEIVLRGEGYDVETVSSQEKALERLADPSIGIVIADTDRGGASNLGGSVPLLDAAGGRPVILFTAHHFSGLAVSEAGFAGYVRKPYDIDDLVRTIDRVLQESVQPLQRGSDGGAELV
jgi:DNA-binding NtrC family response regulator